MVDREVRKQLIDNKMVAYKHMSLGRGHVTIAAVMVEYPEGDAEIYYGLSFCSPRDTFIKAVGRRQALNRLSLILQDREIEIESEVLVTGAIYIEDPADKPRRVTLPSICWDNYVATVWNIWSKSSDIPAWARKDIEIYHAALFASQDGLYSQPLPDDSLEIEAEPPPQNTPIQHFTF